MEAVGFRPHSDPEPDKEHTMPEHESCQCGHSNMLHIAASLSCRIRGCRCDRFDATPLVAVSRDDLARLLVTAPAALADQAAYDRLRAAVEAAS